MCKTVVISIHASREGSDYSFFRFIQGYLQFQSTLPAREATLCFPGCPPATGYFNPRFPRGKRQRLLPVSAVPPYFNPRFPRGKRLRQIPPFFSLVEISIHASREGSDPIVY